MRTFWFIVGGVVGSVIFIIVVKYVYFLWYAIQAIRNLH